MKIKSLLLSIALLLPFAATAQTNFGFANFVNTVLGYFTSFNTNLDSTFGANKFDLWTGASSIQNADQPLVNDIGVSYDIWRPTPGAGVAVKTALALENVIRNSGVAGTLTAENFGLGFSIIVHDVKLTLYGDAGYLLEKDVSRSDRFYGEIGMRVKKAIGLHFYSGVGLAAQIPRNAQVFSIFGGATF
jgi:hypothetical protein